MLLESSFSLFQMSIDWVEVQLSKREESDFYKRILLNFSLINYN